VIIELNHDCAREQKELLVAADDKSIIVIIACGLG
jgi:hypothetical protein